MQNRKIHISMYARFTDLYIYISNICKVHTCASYSTYVRFVPLGIYLYICELIDGAIPQRTMNCIIAASALGLLILERA